VKLKTLTIEKLTAFDAVSFHFAPGVNVFIGENATGKSHVLKLLYVLNEAVRHTQKSQAGDGGLENYATLKNAVENLLQQTFLPDDLGRLVRRAVGRRKATVSATWDTGIEVTVTVTSQGTVKATAPNSLPALERSVFVPPREVLSLFPGFISAWRERESNFDRTYYDLCTALDARPLRGPRSDRRAKLLGPMEAALHGKVTVKNGRFYVSLPDGDMEVPLVAEGLRKLAMLAYLVTNGSLSENGYLFWDEPEANMNPKLAKDHAAVIRSFGDWSVQTFVATHDYALASELSLDNSSSTRTRGSLREDAAGSFLGLAAQDSAKPSTRSSFFGLSRSNETEGVQVEVGARLEDLSNNPILDALTDLHDREVSAEAD
jgi:energy-coupling factor transporter ATP-binding protein EcfA2